MQTAHAKHAVSKTISYFKGDLWKNRPDNITRFRRLIVKFLQVCILSVRGFIKDNCILRASSLTFYSLLSIVPVVAMAFGIAKGFGFEKRLEKQLLQQIPGQEEVLLQVVDSAYRFLENTKGGLIAGIGIVVLFWSVIKVLGHIEHSFNVIWRVDKPRSFGRRFADYLSIMLIGPVFFIMSSSVTVYITTQITEITRKVELIGLFSQVIFALLKLLPYGLIWSLFTIVYILMPNTKVRLVSGLTAGIVAGTAYQVVQWAYIAFQIGVARYNAIYGSFAALPLFLVWLQISWLVVLFGAQISYALQHTDSHAHGLNRSRISLHLRKLLALLIARTIIARFRSGDPPPTAADLADSLSLPSELVQDLLETLVESGTFSRIENSEDSPPVFQPAVSTALLTINYLVNALERNGADDPYISRHVQNTEEWQQLNNALDAIQKIIDDSPANKPLRDL